MQAIPTTLANLARALQQNPWYLSIVLVTYADGYFINAYMLPMYPRFGWIIPELVSGMLWIGLVTAILLASSHEHFPLNAHAGRFVLIACLVTATGTLGIFLVMIVVNHALQGIAQEIQATYRWDLGLVFKLATGAFGVTGLLWFVVVVVKGARRAIRRIMQPNPDVGRAGDSR